MNKKVKKTLSKSNKVNTIIAVQAIVILLLGITVAILSGQAPRVVTNFDQCAELFEGNVVETKTWTRVERACDINGERFYQRDMNSTTSPQKNQDNPSSKNNSGKSFVGLTEEEATTKANEDNTPIRVVERDGEPLPATMDLVDGRVNLYVKNGVVYKAIVERAV